MEAIPGVTPPGEMLPAAASLKEEDEEKEALVVQLVTRGVDKAVAEKLVSRSSREHVSAMLRRGEAEAEGPGWYVRAIEDGYRSYRDKGSGGMMRYTHAAALAALEKRGLTLDEQHPFGKYFDTIRENGTVSFMPTAFFRNNRTATRT